MPRRPKTLSFWAGRLPHWEVEDGRYFITIHLAGAIPAAGRLRLRTLAAQLRTASARHSAKWLELQRAIFAEMESWLGRAEWNPHLQNRDVARLIAEAIETRHERGDWHVFEYVIMPTHLHLFCELGPPGMKTVLEDFKRWTGHRAAELLKVGPVCRTGPGTTLNPDSAERTVPAERTYQPVCPTGPERNNTGEVLSGRQDLPATPTYRFWQREWFDHWSRSDEEDDRIVAYIRQNPVKASLVATYQDWPHASWSRK
jgi:REP element-mobilizing transposase RayT